MKHYRKLFILIVMAFFTVFFTVLHPVPIMDGDDMIYILQSRAAIPYPGAWNPAKVLPEVLMPLCGNLSGMMAALGLGSFMSCQVFVLALMFSAFIGFYTYCFMRVLEKRMGADRFTAIALSVLFLLFHFLALRTGKTDNQYLFFTFDANCVFNYVIPVLLNCGMTMLLIGVENSRALISEGSVFKRALFVTGVYFAVFSNLFASVVLAAYVGFYLLHKLIICLRAKSGVKEYARENIVYIVILAMWLVALCLEGTGDRASIAYNTSGSVFARLGASLAVFSAKLAETSLLIRLIALFAVAGAVPVLFFRCNKEERKDFLTMVIIAVAYALATGIFLILFGTITTTDYLSRIDVVFGFFAVMLFIVMLCICLIVRKFALLELLLPVAIIFTYTMTNTDGHTFKDINELAINGHLALEIQEDICQQILTGAESGAEEITVYVVKTNDGWSNWPHSLSLGDEYAKIFYKYGLIDRPVKVTVVPSYEFNEKYGLKMG